MYIHLPCAVDRGGASILSPGNMSIEDIQAHHHIFKKHKHTIAHICIHTYINTNTQICTDMHIHTHARMPAHTHSHTYTHTHMEERNDTL